jgi:hypothetical protein
MSETSVKRVGRPPVYVVATEVARLRTQGASWREISEQLGVGATTARRAFSGLAKTPAESSIPSKPAKTQTTFQPERGS